MDAFDRFQFSHTNPYDLLGLRTVLLVSPLCYEYSRTGAGGKPRELPKAKGKIREAAFEAN